MSEPNTIAWDEIREQVLSEPAVRAEYEALAAEFTLARQLIALRQSSGLTQREFAQRVGIKQPQLARLESGKQLPKLDTLQKLAAGAGYTVEVRFVPSDPERLQEVEPLHLGAGVEG
jgi:DNA-binding XRE family transcriptional regulator